MRKHFLTFLLMALIACKEEGLPEGILNIDKMAAVLVDIHLAEGKIDELKLYGDTARFVFKHLELEVFEKHQVEEDVYKKSFEYHLDNISTMDQIYSRVIDSLNVRKQVSRVD